MTLIIGIILVVAFVVVVFKILITDGMTAQDIERLREERRNLGRMRSYPNPLFPPKSDEPQTPLEGTEEGSPDDLPF